MIYDTIRAAVIKVVFLRTNMLLCLRLFVNKIIRIIYFINYDVMYKIVDAVFDGAEL